MTTSGPEKHILIADIQLHAEAKRKESDFAREQDWSDPSCDRCYLAWLHSIQSKDSWACTGNPNRQVCVSYAPPMLPHVQATNMQALRSFTNDCVDKGILDESAKVYDH